MTKISAKWLKSPGSLRVISMLEEAGYQAYFVGGCVRNALIGAPVNDLDLATDALPQEILTLAPRAGLTAHPTGIDHGTVTIVADGQAFEITTFRKDVETDGRHAIVSFSKHLEVDAMRRDFTMNALYCNKHGHITDPVGGLEDIRQRAVKFIADPALRIKEDYLRILRFFRFHAWYGSHTGGIDPEGLAACAELASGLGTIAKERIGAEFVKTLAAPDPAPAIAAMAYSGILARVLPGANPTSLAPLIHLEETHEIAPNSMRRLATIFSSDAKDCLRLSNSQDKEFRSIQGASHTNMNAAELGYRYGARIASDIVLVRAAHMAKATIEKELQTAQRAASHIFPIEAHDLMPLYQGKALGEHLLKLERKWIDSDFTLTKCDLMDLS